MSHSNPLISGQSYHSKKVFYN